jgi:hypothetical protein
MDNTREKLLQKLANNYSDAEMAFPLSLWKEYLIVASLEDIAVSWRIFTSIAAHAAILAVKKSLCMGHLVSNDSNDQAVKDMTKLICSRLENVSWRVWYEKSHCVKTAAAASALEPQAKSGQTLFKQNSKASSAASLQRAISEPSIFGLSLSAREQQEKVTDWLSDFEKNLELKSRSNNIQPTEEDDLSDDYSDDDDCSDCSCDSLMHSSYEKSLPIASSQRCSLLTQLILSTKSETSVCSPCTVPDKLKDFVSRKSPAQPCLQAINVLMCKNNSLKPTGPGLKSSQKFFDDNIHIW